MAGRYHQVGHCITPGAEPSSHGQKELEEFGEAEPVVLDDDLDEIMMRMMVLMMMISILLSFEPLNFTFNFDYYCWNNFHFHSNIISICQIISIPLPFIT